MVASVIEAAAHRVDAQQNRKSMLRCIHFYIHVHYGLSPLLEQVPGGRVRRNGRLIRVGARVRSLSRSKFREVGAAIVRSSALAHDGKL